MDRPICSPFSVTRACTVSNSGAPAFDEIQRRLAAKGEEMQLAIRIQREDIFSAMHTI